MRRALERSFVDHREVVRLYLGFSGKNASADFFERRSIGLTFGVTSPDFVQRAIEHGCPPAIIRRQVSIAARQGESIGLSNDR